jgi:hypothetical protein
MGFLSHCQLCLLMMLCVLVFSFAFLFLLLLFVCVFIYHKIWKFFAQLCQMIHILSVAEGVAEGEVMVTNLLLLMLQKQKSQSVAETKGETDCFYFLVWFLRMRANLVGGGCGIRRL